MNTNALEINHLVKKYGQNTAVNDLSFLVKEGEFFGFLGPNGAGKTTTISAITGTAKIDSGEIKVFGLDVETDYREARKKIGLSPQEFNIDSFASAYQTLDYIGGYFGLPKTKRKERIRYVSNILGLIGHIDKPFRTLSGGYKRRVMLARAIIHDPDLLILDEPTAGVDVELRHDLWGILTDLNKQGKTILLTTHYLEEAQKLCERIGIIFGGKLVALESKEELIKDGKSIEDHYLSYVGAKRGEEPSGRKN